MALSAVLKLGMLGTSDSIISVTRHPLSDSTLRSSMPRRLLSSKMLKPSGMLLSVDRCAYIRSKSMPFILNVIMGTYASGTLTSSVTEGSRSRKPCRPVKKCCRVMCFGPTHSVSMSVPGPCTPSRYEPNV